VETAPTDGNPLEERADSHSWLDKPEQNTCSALSTVTTGPAAINPRGVGQIRWSKWAKSGCQNKPLIRNSLARNLCQHWQRL